MSPNPHTIIDALCSVTGDRRPGSAGNDEAVDYVAAALRASGWSVDLPEFACLDWAGGEAGVVVGDLAVPAVAAPYGLGVATAGPIRLASTRDDLDRKDLTGAVVVVSGDLASEPMTPKAFPFYGSDEHTAIIETLEAAEPVAVIAVTGKYPELCGALDPYPWIEDGDFEVPVASVRPDDAEPLLASEGETAEVTIDGQRIPSQAHNVVAQRGPLAPRVTICAHIDTKPGTPGAVDNAAGVATLVRLAELLGTRDDLPVGVELLAVNGEDHFAAAGELAWLEANEGRLDDIDLFINIDGAGYRRGRTAYSLYNVEEGAADDIRTSFADVDDLVEGPAWYQSDHAIFAMRGRSAMAFTTEYVDEMLAELFHSEHDTVDQVDPERIENLSRALADLIVDWPNSVFNG